VIPDVLIKPLKRSSKQMHQEMSRPFARRPADWKATSVFLQSRRVDVVIAGTAKQPPAWKTEIAFPRNAGFHIYSNDKYGEIPPHN
jgi:hypothetical protein